MFYWLASRQLAGDVSTSSYCSVPVTDCGVVVTPSITDNQRHHPTTSSTAAPPLTQLPRHTADTGILANCDALALDPVSAVCRGSCVSGGAAVDEVVG